MIVGQTIEKLRALNAYATLDIMMMVMLMLYAPPVINVARLAMEQEKMLVRVAIRAFNL